MRHDNPDRTIHLAIARTIAFSLLVASASMLGAASAQGPSEASPAARPIPATITPQSYAPELVEVGRVRFAADCGFCHGRDAAGGTGGSDLTRSQLVAEDLHGNRIADVVRTGRAEAGMPAFPTIAESDLAAITAFIHEQKAQAASATGGRRSVEVADLQTGDARAGRRYFESHCTDCHSATGDLSGIASRFSGLALLRRMLFPGSAGPGAPPPAPPSVTVSTREGERVDGMLAYHDEFTIALIDASGRYRSWPTRHVDVEIDDPLEAHVAALARYTDADMHDVLAFLQTLR